MYTAIKKLSIILLIILPGIVLAGSSIDKNKGDEKKLIRLAEKKLQPNPWDFSKWKHTGKITLDSINVVKNVRVVNLYFSPQFTHIPIRFNEVETIKQKVKNQLGRRFKSYSINIYTNNQLVETYIPNFFRYGDLKKDNNRYTTTIADKAIVKRVFQNHYAAGLSNRHIALWPGHGWYFEQNLDRWEWQRARLFQTVEDLYPYSIVRSYLVPMLENSGACVFLPRERCTQRNEVIVDNDHSTGQSELVITNGTYNWETIGEVGFAKKEILTDGENPFKMGSHLRIKSGGEIPGSVLYIPEIPEDGDYAVYMSWAQSNQNIEGVRCKINYHGGTAEFILNQKMGAGTWIYLGTFWFKKGKDYNLGSLELSSDSAENGFITTDAVRFGGGMGNIARGNMRNESFHAIAQEITIADTTVINEINKPSISGRPRFMEGARYFLQYSGMPDSTVYNLNKGKKDYNDDYMSRGEWVNYLMGNPNGPTGYPEEKGLSIPVDLALSFHTDAGVTTNDSIIGTLAIYSTRQGNGFFPNGKSRLASRDLSDLIQTQLVEDIRVKYNHKWTRRGLWDREYSEAWRPNTPAMLLELLSHQNLADMKYGLDPRFQFDISRSIYKGMLRFLNGVNAVVQPLPPTFMQIEFIIGKKIKISWQPTNDPLESTALTEYYKVYCQTEDGGFNTGTLTYNNYLELELEEWQTIYNFRVTAINSGGESFPGESLAVSLLPHQKPQVLIVNNFDRISSPSFFDTGEKAGIEWWEDEGVSNGMDYSKTGDQYDYNRQSKWLDDDSPGWGASHANKEGTGIPGNTFNFTLVHGKAFRNAGYAFVSISNESFETLSASQINQYNVVDLICGEQRGTSNFRNSGKQDFRVFTRELMEKLEVFSNNKGNIIISGAYIGTDMIENNDTTAINFAKKILGYKWMTNHATNVGELSITNEAGLFFPKTISFNTNWHKYLYKVEAPDAIEPSGAHSYRLYRYNSNNTSGAILYNGNHKAVSFGFPLETITSPNQLTDIIKSIMNYFENK